MAGTTNSHAAEVIRGYHPLSFPRTQRLDHLAYSYLLQGRQYHKDHLCKNAEVDSLGR